jgi:hypothetical protein
MGQKEESYVLLRLAHVHETLIFERSNEPWALRFQRYSNIRTQTNGDEGNGSLMLMQVTLIYHYDIKPDLLSRAWQGEMGRIEDQVEGDNTPLCLRGFKFRR